MREHVWWLHFFYMGKQKTTEQFIEESKNVHGNKYDYSKTKYINSKTKLCITCPEHGDFWQLPCNHLKGKGCMKCSMNKKPQCLPIGKEAFVEKAKKIHGEKYDYSLVQYVNGLEDVVIICPEHGEFKQKPQNHLDGCGCQKCGEKSRGKTLRWNKEKFIEEARKIHGEKYDYSLVDYKNTDTPVKITCPEHGIFEQTPYHHLRRKQGCPICKTSGLETTVRVILEENGIQFNEQKTFPWLKGNYGWPLKYDFYIPEQNTAIECQGLQHFQPSEFFGGDTAFKEILERDSVKRKLSKEHGVKLLYFSNLNIDYPYEVITDKNSLIEEVLYQE